MSSLLRFFLLVSIIISSVFPAWSNRNIPGTDISSSIIYLKGNWQYLMSDSSLQSSWFNQKKNDLSWKEITYPNQFDQPCHTDIWFRKTLPDWDGGNPALFIRIVKSIMEVYVDGNKIYTTGDFSSKQKIKFGGYDWYLLGLPYDFAGKTLILHIRANHNYPGIMGDVLLGSEKNILSNLVEKNILFFILGLLFISSGLLSILILYLLKGLKTYLGFIVLQVSIGIWTVVNSPIMQLIVDAPKAIYLLDHISMYAAVIGFMMLAETIIATSYKIIIKRIRQFLILVSLGLILIDFTLKPFHRYVAIPYYILVLCSIIIFMFYSYKSYRISGRNEKLFLLGLNIYALFAFVEIAMYYAGFFITNGSFDNVILHIGGICLFFFITWIIISQYVEMNRKVITTRERERERIARDLHDEIGPRLTQIKMVSEMVSQKVVPGEELREKLEELSFASDNAFSSFREIVWALNPGNNTLEELGTYLGQYASEFLSAAHISCRLGLPSEFPRLEIPYDIRRNIIMAVKESLNNVVKHAGAMVVKVEVNVVDGKLNIRIIDNGCGFAIDKANRYGNGLKNIHYRIDNFGGKVTIESEINHGTTISLFIPIEALKQ
jgi:signal transduction histidine kinase